MPFYKPGELGYYQITKIREDGHGGQEPVYCRMEEKQENIIGYLTYGTMFSALVIGQGNNQVEWLKIEQARHTDTMGDVFIRNLYSHAGGHDHPANIGYAGYFIHKIHFGVDAIDPIVIEAKNEDLINTQGKGFTTLIPMKLEATEVAKELYDVYTPFKTTEAYAADLDGLRITDLRGIIGMPNQFLPITDPRITYEEEGPRVGPEDGLGRIYTEYIISNIPLLLMTPGLPTFMSGYDKSEKATVMAKLKNSITGNSEGFIDQAYDDLVNGETGKYYTLKFAYTDYFYYLNAMLRSAAYFLGIEEEYVGEKKLKEYNWFYRTSSDGSSKYDAFNLSDYLGPYAGAIPFYADVGNTTDDSFSNGTAQSGLSSTINSLSDQGRELNFLIGNIGGVTGVQLDRLTGMDSLESNITDVQNQLSKLLPGGNILSKLVGNAQTILAGGRMIFPEIWEDSNFSRSYSVKMKLIASSGNPLDVYMHILVPIYFLLAFVLPRQSTGQSYMSPFLVRAYSKSLFNVDMGIITGLSITKGSEGEWTADGLPTVAEVSFEIKDLYNGMYMSTYQNSGELNMFRNITELDYIANSCGININEPDLVRTLKMYLNMNLVKKVEDAVTIGFLGRVSQHFNQKFQNIFGKF